MRLTEMLNIQPGTTAVIGGGGKTSLLRTLGHELSAQGLRVILCTTTRIRAFQDIPGGSLAGRAEIADALNTNTLIWTGTPCGNGKWRAPAVPIRELQELADYIIVEADGSAGLPFKAHRSFEPVVPPEANQTILVMGASGFGLSIARSAHCAALFAKRAGCDVTEMVTPEVAARVADAEHLHDRIFVNQADSAAHRYTCKALASRVREPLCAGSLYDGKKVPTLCSL